MHSRNQDGAIYGVLHTIPKLTMEIKFGTVDASKHMNDESLEICSNLLYVDTNVVT